MEKCRVLTLKKNKEFSFVYRKGNSRATRMLVATVAKSRYGGLRAGFSVSKKIGNAVTRNKIRRRLKEAYRSYLPEMEGNYCIIFVARKGIENALFSLILKDMGFLLKKHSLLSEKKSEKIFDAADKIL